MPILLIIALSTALAVSSRGARVLATLAALDAGAFQIGLLFALQALFPLLLTIYAGRIADRLNNSLLIYRGIGGYALSLAFPYIWPGLPALYASAALAGVTSMLYVLSFRAVISEFHRRAVRTAKPGAQLQLVLAGRFDRSRAGLWSAAVDGICVQRRARRPLGAEFHRYHEESKKRGLMPYAAPGSRKSVSLHRTRGPECMAQSPRLPRRAWTVTMQPSEFCHVPRASHRDLSRH